MGTFAYVESFASKRNELKGVVREQLLDLGGGGATFTAGGHFSSMNSDLELHIGRRLRSRRRLMGLTQKQLADMIGVVPQQIQKYECASTTLSADRLWDVSQHLGVAIAYFFDGFDPDRLTRSERNIVRSGLNGSTLP